jgi:hypothetical protein
MALPQLIEPQTDVCVLADRWKISIQLAVRLILLRSLAGRNPGFRGTAGEVPRLFIISGYRDPERQAQICREAPPGRPCAHPDRSTHTSCPATGADLRIESGPPDAWALLGTIWTRELGGRWGGEFETPDPNHFDLGAR